MCSADGSPESLNKMTPPMCLPQSEHQLSEVFVGRDQYPVRFGGRTQDLLVRDAWRRLAYRYDIMTLRAQATDDHAIDVFVSEQLHADFRDNG